MRPRLPGFLILCQRAKEKPIDTKRKKKARNDVRLGRHAPPPPHCLRRSRSVRIVFYRSAPEAAFPILRLAARWGQESRRRKESTAGASADYDLGQSAVFRRPVPTGAKFTNHFALWRRSEKAFRAQPLSRSDHHDGACTHGARDRRNGCDALALLRAQRRLLPRAVAQPIEPDLSGAAPARVERIGDRARGRHDRFRPYRACPGRSAPRIRLALAHLRSLRAQIDYPQVSRAHGGMACAASPRAPAGSDRGVNRRNSRTSEPLPARTLA